MLTVGPSDESSQSTACIGEAAHISAASPGGRRYDAALTHQERSSINNGIWLCGHHAKLIDRDAVTYSASVLHNMKRGHEAACANAVCSGSGGDFDVQLFAIGDYVVFTGVFDQVDAGAWTLQIKNFLIGDFQEIVSYISDFANRPADERYVISNELGEGRILSSAPSLSMQETHYILHCPVEPAAPRINVQRIGSGMAVQVKTNDLYLDERGNIARAAGLDYFPQRVREVLSMQRGESIYAPRVGVRFFEYFSRYVDSPWLNSFLKLEVIRQTSIPMESRSNLGTRTPLQCVGRVHTVELLSTVPIDNRVPLRVEFDVQGMGRWKYDASIYMPTNEQMDKCKERLKLYPFLSLENGGDS
jgi:hypothetical protein